MVIVAKSKNRGNKMAKIIAEFDTVTKELSVKMNDKQMGDVSSAFFMSDWEDKKKGYVEITSVNFDEDEGMSRVERIMAGEEEFKLMDTTLLVNAKENIIAEEMANLMSQKRKNRR
jgi:hypothetical protein